MLKNTGILTLVVLVLSSQSFADTSANPLLDNQSQQTSSSPTISQIEQANDNILDIEKVMQAADNLEHDVKIMMEIRFSDCLKAIGNSDFCNCINRKLPINVSFIGYVQVTVTDQDILNKKIIQSNDPEASAFIKKIQTIRETCVQQNQKK